MIKKFFSRTAAGLTSLCILAGISGLSPDNAFAAENGLSINEVCSKNTVYAAPDGNYYDWVELYNSSGSDADISGYGLSDKSSKPFRYVFPAGTIVPAGGSLVVFCDSNAALTNSSIAPFGLSASGETLTFSDASGSAVDTLTFGALVSDTSYGQYPDGSGEYYNLSCTPGEKNSAPEGSNAVRMPEFSHKSGFYGSSFQLTISVPEGTTVYYTTDGSDPTADSEKYTAPITVEDMSNTPNRLSARTDISASGATAPNGNVDKAAVIRAAAIDSEGRVSNIVTNTYFIGKTNSGYYKNMKVISLVTDPDNLFDYETGIYVKGKVYDDENEGSGGWGGWGGFGWNMKNPWEMAANYTQKGREWEREASMEVFDSGESVLAQNVGIRIKGAASRSSVQKSFNVYARQDYGKSELEYDFFAGTARKAKNNKSISVFDSIVIRNGGNDNGYFYFRDTINQQLVADRDMAVQAMSECILFIDGEFWGVYQITEKVSDDYIKDHYGIKKSDVAIIKNKSLEEGTDADLADWNDLIAGVANGSVSYSQFAEKVDIASFMDYFAAQIYWNNWDWPQNNVAVWRSNAIDETNPYADGKWRMFLFDTEYSTGLYGSEDTQVNTDPFTRIRRNTDDLSKAFIALLNDRDFSEQFARTFMDLANYNFAPEKATAVVDKYKELYRQQILDTYARFYSDTLSGYLGEQQFNSEYTTIRDFYQNRFSYAESSMKRAASLTGGLSTVEVNNDSSKGTIKFNTLTLNEDRWSGKYHSDYEITVSAEPVSGSRFDHWEISGAELSSGTLTSPDISFHAGSGVKITAVYGDALRGDYNGDGSISVADLTALSRFLLGADVKLADADMVQDGVTDTFDLVELRKIVLQYR